MDLSQPAARNLFYPSSRPTRRRRWRMPWAAVAGVVSALVSAWMIWQVHDIYSTRQKKRLEEIYSPKTPVSREQETPRELVKSPPALTELRYPSRYASSRRP